MYTQPLRPMSPQPAQSHFMASRKDTRGEIISSSGISLYRPAIESFIRKRFSQAYGATINSFLPVLVASVNVQVNAVIGVRAGYQPLMVEQYLDSSIVDTLAQHGINTTGSEIAEIGNLCSTSQRYTLPLLLTTVSALWESGFNYMVFTANQQVRSMFERFGLAATSLCNATQEAVSNGPDNWGSYYDNNPEVMVLSLATVNNVINENTLFTHLLKGHKSDQTKVTRQLRCFA